MIERSRHLNLVKGLLDRFPVVAVLGARQVGKTTLAKALVEKSGVATHTFDLEDPNDAARLQDPMLALKDLQGSVILDEVQTRPDIFPVLRVLADRQPQKAKFLILGSASPHLIRHSSESLAGRLAQYELQGLNLDEVGEGQLDKLWLRGGFPRSFLAESGPASSEWRQSFVRTFLERDLPQLGVGIPSLTVRKFWTMLAHAHGQVFNASELGRSLGVSDTSVRRYLEILSSTYVVRLLLPWHENLKKRQVKSPKVFISDSGLLHSLLNLPAMEDLEGHPKLGASWEGFVINELLARLGAAREESFFWATHTGAELDLLVVRGKKRIGFEVKRTLAPKLTPSMKIALNDLGLDRIYVIYPGEKSWPITGSIHALPCSSIWTELPVL